MADTKVSNLDSITVADNNDVLYIVDTSASASKKITFQNLLSGVNLSITNLDSTVTEFTNTVLSLSSDFEQANLDVGPLQTDFLLLSSRVDAVSAVQEARPEGVSQSIVISTSTFTFDGGQLISVTS